MNPEQSADYLGVTIQKLLEYVEQKRIEPTLQRARPKPEERPGVYSKSEPNETLEAPPQEICFDMDDLKRLKKELEEEKKARLKQDG